MLQVHTRHCIYYPRVYMIDGILKIFFDFVAFYLNPRFQYGPGVGEDMHLIQAVHQVFNTLDPNSEGIAQFGNEVK